MTRSQDGEITGIEITRLYCYQEFNYKMKVIIIKDRVYLTTADVVKLLLQLIAILVLMYLFLV